MGGGACVVIIDGNAVQGEAARLSSTAIASCQLVDYLGQDEDIQFNIADAKPIEDFHARAKAVIKRGIIYFSAFVRKQVKVIHLGCNLRQDLTPNPFGVSGWN